ncbi:class I SAM-dependent methyltransferase [Methylobacterium gossipiicola]|uniref:Methyltransferase domain-containing protein n=1 Tax=Methylobacterium gossipiicola TaxID=582675 RepID=A0A1I2XA96_9HYPH|nr:class I SAM-dependent methyltransferase [Methylobacterium gossipiicola]SFH09606.1 Methyltransferase domain-containing protein [Methylobacterium gossipiicola]
MMQSNDYSGTGVTASSWDEKYLTGRKSAWTENLLVAREINRRMTNDPSMHWLNWFFEKFLDRKPGKVLSIGCGDGAHELIMARCGYVDHVHGFDASSAGIARAKAAADTEGLAATFEVKLFEEFSADPPIAVYDMVMFAGALHHVRNIEDMLFAVQRTLKPEGLLLVNEYIGPAYQLYPKNQLDIVNLVLRLSSPEMRLGHDTEVRLPTMQMIYEADPSEGVRAPLIRPLLPHFFSPLFERLNGGGLLHALFDGLNANKVNDNSPESNAYIAACIDLENILTASNFLPHDFMFGCYKNDKSNS